ncbi:hypothetical protein OUZ56_033724 [Daphnia magna]|uniref:Uncharacterized protein n=1 Tax=Daphnia magna TaxID=35525 RepID=A0ABQ9ZY59_9CRUS|nr:hypothetical protein OUZ56_033724 [Daphnia magna]
MEVFNFHKPAGDLVRCWEIEIADIYQIKTSTHLFQSIADDITLGSEGVGGCLILDVVYAVKITRQHEGQSSSYCVGVRCEGSLEIELGNLLPCTRPQQRSGRAYAGERSRRRAAEEAAKEIKTYYSGLRAATPLARSSTGLQAASAASSRSKGRSRGPPGEVSDLTLGQKGTWLSREVSLPREVPDPSQFQSDSEPRGEEFEDAQSCQDSGNPEAGGAVMEGAYESVAARKQHEGAREVGNEGGVNARTGAGNEKRQEVRVVDRDQGSRTRQAEFDDRESLIPQVSVSSVQERIDEQRRKSYDPNSLGTQGSVTGNREVWQGSAWAEAAADRERIVSVEADTSGVINRSSGSDSGQPLEARNDEQRGVGLKRRSLREGLRPRAFSTPQEAAAVRQGRGGVSVGGSPSRQSLEDPELEWDPFLEEEEDMAERPMFHYKEPEKFRGTPKENAMEWIDRFERIA